MSNSRILITIYSPSLGSWSNVHSSDSGHTGGVPDASYGFWQTRWYRFQGLDFILWRDLDGTDFCSNCC